MSSKEDPLLVQKITEKKKGISEKKSGSKSPLVPRVATLKPRAASVDSISKPKQTNTTKSIERTLSSQNEKKEKPTITEPPKTTEIPTVESTKSKFVYVAPKLDTEHLHNWVTLSLRCISWRYLHFSLELPVDTPVDLLRQKIIDHHSGTVGYVVMFKGRVSKENLLPFSTPKTLLQCGIKGGKKEEHVQSVVYYDFEAFQTGKEEEGEDTSSYNVDDPVLNYKPRQR